MINTTDEHDYYLISELITMSDRILAEQLELWLWPDHANPNAERWELALQTLKDSKNPEQFADEMRRVLLNSGIKFEVGEGQPFGGLVNVAPDDREQRLAAVHGLLRWCAGQYLKLDLAIEAATCELLSKGR